jgi:HlyD family secretion protein
LPVLAVLAVLWLVLYPSAPPSNIVAVSGRVEGDETSVAARTAGRVKSISVREGDAVAAGDVMVVLDDDQVRAREDQATAALQQAEFKVRSAQRQIDVLTEQLRQSQLAVGQAALDTRGRVREARRLAEAAHAALAQAIERRRAAERQVSYMQEQLQQSRLAVGQSELDAQGRYHQAEQQLASAVALHRQAEVASRMYDIDVARYDSLLSQGYVPLQVDQYAHTHADAQHAAVQAAAKQVEAARSWVTATRAGLANPAVRRSQQAAATHQLFMAQADLDGAQAAVRQAQAQHEQARANVLTAQALLTNPAVRRSQQEAARQQIEQAHADLLAAQAATRQAQGRLDEARADRRELEVRAPFSGTITTRVAEPGEVVGVGAVLLTMLDTSQLYLRAFVPEGDIGRVKLRQSARVFLDSDPRKPLDAVVGRIDPELTFTPENTYFRSDRVKQVTGVRLYLVKPDGSAKAGMPADGEVLTSGSWPRREPWR